MWDSTLAFMRSPVQRKNAAMRRTGRASSRKDILLDHISPVQRKNAAMRRTGRASSRKDILLDHISPVQRKNAN